MLYFSTFDYLKNMQYVCFWLIGRNTPIETSTFTLMSIKWMWVKLKILIFDTNCRISDVWYGFCFWIFFLDAITHSCVSLSWNSSELMIKIDGSNEQIQGNWYQWRESIIWRPVRESIAYKHLHNWQIKISPVFDS